MQGQVDVTAIFTATSYMNLVALKLDPEKISAGSTMPIPGSIFIPTA